MSDDSESIDVPRQTVLPPFSSPLRTLYHPSFMSVYLAAGSNRYPWPSSNQTITAMTPLEFFYTDHNMCPGRRVPNIISEMQVFKCFRLNTPPPVMSACPAPPARPDPFRSGSYPTRDLGCSTWRRNPNYCHQADRPRPRSKKSQSVIELTLEEDQAITNLLTLHHQQHIHTDGLPVHAIQKDLHENGVLSVANMTPDHQTSLSHTPLDQSAVTEGMRASHRDRPLHSVAIFRGERHRETLGSSVEMEAADALLRLGEN
ncbi:uncharacterized protein LOC124487026 [Hypomesus transpacificus]|uniref:uncharacterized protein LOC124487026 n=1 Tax=Hypomesus transpacificus TaxID=137520 RepID=UPI001F0863A1|nr:uncharacterized protein LOC124487026 [Hypomesus transpacificus]